jgi:hypothetical protein
MAVVGVRRFVQVEGVEVAVGGGGGVVGVLVETVTVVLFVTVPPAPVQVSVYLVVCRGVRVTEPLVLPPVEKPLPVHPVALVLLQVSVELCPVVTVEGRALMDAVGAGTVVELVLPVEVAESSTMNKSDL